jgi:hypothetical protein
VTTRRKNWCVQVPVRGEPLLKLSLVLSLLIGALAPLATAARRGTLFCFGGRRPRTVTLSGTVSYTGRQTGIINVLAANDADTWLTGPSAQGAAPGAYVIASVASDAHCWVRAFRDMDANGICEPWEARGDCPVNPLALPGKTSGLDVALTDPDIDTDGMPDWWEMRFWRNLVAQPHADPDTDGRSNLQEYTEGTDPIIANITDTDNTLNLTVYTPLKP